MMRGNATQPSDESLHTDDLVLGKMFYQRRHATSRAKTTDSLEYMKPMYDFKIQDRVDIYGRQNESPLANPY